MKTFKYIIPLLLTGWVTDSQAQTSSAVATPVASASVSSPAVAPSNLAFGVTQVLKLQQGGLGKDVLMNYVNSANLSFALRADDIIYLHQVGVPEEVITTMMERERNHMAVAQSSAPVEEPQSQSVAQVNPSAAQVAPATTTFVSQPSVVYTTPTYVSYPSYPAYSYPYYGGYGYGWGVPLSLNFGFGWGGHYHGGWGGGGWHGGGGGFHHH